MKLCGRCRKRKPLDAFHRWRNERQPWCKDCRRVYDAAYHQKVKHRRLQQKREYHRVFLAWSRTLKEGKPCADCGQVFHPAAMHWDHLPGFSKTGNLGDLARRHNRSRVIEEIKKCELVCANCHAVRTLSRVGA
jgi:hypothetical protein